jgi:hypothetical protein
VPKALSSAGRNVLQIRTNYGPKGDEENAYSNVTLRKMEQLREFECEITLILVVLIMGFIQNYYVCLRSPQKEGMKLECIHFHITLDTCALICSRNHAAKEKKNKFSI